MANGCRSDLDAGAFPPRRSNANGPRGRRPRPRVDVDLRACARRAPGRRRDGLLRLDVRVRARARRAEPARGSRPVHGAGAGPPADRPLARHRGDAAGTPPRGRPAGAREDGADATPQRCSPEPRPCRRHAGRRPGSGRRACPGARAGPAGQGAPRVAAPEARRAARPGEEGRSGPAAAAAARTGQGGRARRRPGRPAARAGQEAVTAGGGPPARLGSPPCRPAGSSSRAQAPRPPPPSSCPPRSRPRAPSRSRAAGRFSEGVMSGEPTPTAISLWSRLHDVEGALSADLEVATDKAFRHVVAHKRDRDERARAATPLKARVTGPEGPRAVLLPLRHQDDRRRRSAASAPRCRPTPTQPVRFAFFSCQDYTHGYYNAHELLADEDLDFVVCLGDYIYAESYHSRKDGTGVRDDKIGSASRDNPRTSARSITLADYRDKYALYRSDTSLRDGAREVPDGDALGRPRGRRTTTPAASRTAGWPPPSATAPRARPPPTRPSSSRCRYSPPRRTASTAGCSSASTSTCVIMDQRQYRDEPAVRRRRRAAVRRLRPAARLPRPHADGRGSRTRCAARRPAGRSWPTRSR